MLSIKVIDSGVETSPEDNNQSFQIIGGSIIDEIILKNKNSIQQGLEISKLIVQQFNGSIQFEYELDKGSNFYLTFETSDMNEQQKSNNQK